MTLIVWFFRRIFASLFPTRKDRLKKLLVSLKRGLFDPNACGDAWECRKLIVQLEVLMHGVEWITISTKKSGEKILLTFWSGAVHNIVLMGKWISVHELEKAEMCACQQILFAVRNIALTHAE